MNALEERCLDWYDTIEECAEALHVTPDFLKEVIDGTRKLDPPTIFAWSTVLNIPANETNKFF